MQYIAPHGALDPYAELQESLTHDTDLGSRTLNAGAESQLLCQNVLSSREQNPQLVRTEARAAGGVYLKAIMKLFDSDVHLAEAVVDLLVQVPLGFLRINRHEALIAPRFPAIQTHYVGFDQHAPLAALSVLGCGAGLAEHVRALTATFRVPSLRGHPSRGTTHQELVFRHADDVVDFRLIFRTIQQRRAAKPAVEPHEDACLGECRPQTFDHFIQDTDHPLLGLRIACSEHMAEQILVDFSIEGQKTDQRQEKPAVVTAANEGELLSAVRPVVRGIQVGRDVLDLAPSESIVPALGDLSAGMLQQPFHPRGPDVPVAFENEGQPAQQKRPGELTDEVLAGAIVRPAVVDDHRPAAGGAVDRRHRFQVPLGVREQQGKNARRARVDPVDFPTDPQGNLIDVHRQVGQQLLDRHLPIR